MNRPNTQEELDKVIYTMASEELKSLRELQEDYEKQSPDEGIESMEGYREPLSMDVTKELNILLSWGGPSDGYKLRFDDEDNLISGVYWYADWGTYAETPLSEEDLNLIEGVYLYGDASSYLHQ